MRRLIVVVLFLFTVVIPLTVFGQTETFDLYVDNQTVSGDEFSFDIYMLRTGAQDIYLANCDLVLTFNEANFTNDTFTLVEKGNGSNKLFDWYGYDLSIASNDRLLLNIGAPPFDSQTQFDQRVQVISNTSPGEKIGTFKITSILNPSGTAGLQWRKSGTNQTIIHTYLNNFPVFTEVDITDNGNYVDPNDQSLPVTLTGFSADIGRNAVILSWITESETNNLGFEVYRAIEEEAEYIMLSGYETNPDLAGQGNSNTQHEYSYTDKSVEPGTTYWYKLADVDFNGVRTFHDPISVEVPKFPEIPTAFELHSNYPNPFNPTTTLRFDIPAGAELVDSKLVIYNSLGQTIKTLVRGKLSPGSYEVQWDATTDSGNSAPSGIYFVVFRTERFSQTRKIVLLK